MMWERWEIYAILKIPDGRVSFKASWLIKVKWIIRIYSSAGEAIIAVKREMWLK